MGSVTGRPEPAAAVRRVARWRFGLFWIQPGTSGRLSTSFRAPMNGGASIADLPMSVERTPRIGAMEIVA